MDFRIADTFTASLARLTGEEQKAVKTTAFDLQMNPAHPSMQLHKLDRAKDKSFWSIRVSSDLRLILHKSAGSLLLCYVDHHDAAYAWAERRRLERHPKTGAAQLVELRETVREIEIPRFVEAAAPAAASAPRAELFAGLSDDELLGYGVPFEWLSDVRGATEDALLALADHLPSEAAEALLELATGVRPQRPLHAAERGPARIADAPTLRALLREASEAGEAHRFAARFLETEWCEVVDAWQLATWAAYRDVARLGRKTRLSEKQRALLWSIFERVRAALDARGLVTIPGVFAKATEQLKGSTGAPFDFVVVDEAQDIGVPQLRFLAALAGDRPDGVFFAGDLGQRIFQTPFSWRSLGVDVRGRSQTLRINYRTSHQIRRQADRLLPAELSDVDGNTEVRRGTVSAFNGPEPVVSVLESGGDESAAIARWLEARTAGGVQAHEIGVFVRSEAQLPRACAAVQTAGLEVAELDGGSDGAVGRVAVATMHLAKGLEFRAVAVAACDDEILPLQARIQAVADDADLEDVYETERQLLYVACTRARDHLLVTGVEPASEFLEDLRDR